MNLRNFLLILYVEWRIWIQMQQRKNTDGLIYLIDLEQFSFVCNKVKFYLKFNPQLAWETL